VCRKPVAERQIIIINANHLTLLNRDVPSFVFLQQAGFEAFKSLALPLKSVLLGLAPACSFLRLSPRQKDLVLLLGYQGHRLFLAGFGVYQVDGMVFADDKFPGHIPHLQQRL
jgi:hypothetical protein